MTNYTYTSDSLPRVTTNHSIVTVDLGTPATLECVTVVPRLLPAESLWYARGALVNKSSRYKIKKNSLQSYISVRTVLSLEIVSVSVRDLGWYTCGVNSSLGTRLARVYLRKKPLTTGTGAVPPTQTSLVSSTGFLAISLVYSLITILNVSGFSRFLEERD